MDLLDRLEFRHIGRVLLHSLLVGAMVGAVSCFFFLLLESSSAFLLEGLAGWKPLRPDGEHGLVRPVGDAEVPLRPFLLVIIPGLGGLFAGLLAHFVAPEVRGGGGNAYVAAFHNGLGLIRRRVAPIKLLASVCSLGTGGSGGREGPTMHIGAALGSLLSQWLSLSARERRILAVAGTAAGISAIFRTPLGAALLAVEVLYRDDFESDALVPAILASVTAYSIFNTVFPSAGPLFSHAPRYLTPTLHLPLYALLAVVISLFATLFLGALRVSRRMFDSLPIPPYLRPALGGLCVGVMALLWIALVNPYLGMGGRGAGLLGSGYGAAQAAISGAAFLQEGILGVYILLALTLAKIVVTAFTIGSGGSAGDFGPSVAIGGLLGGAFGRVAQMTIAPEIDPGAFALVGMGTFYGGLAHTPVSSLVMVCEMAGSYDLLVPLMVSEGVVFLLLRRQKLYEAQVISRFESPAHEGSVTMDVLKTFKAGATVKQNRPFSIFAPTDSVSEIVRVVTEAAAWQDTFPVLDRDKKLLGLLSGDAIRTLITETGLEGLALAADVMMRPVVVRTDEDLHAALERLLESGLRELPVVDEGGTIVGLLDETDIARAYHDLTAKKKASLPSRV